MDDILLWDLWRLDYKDALTVLFKKYHRQIVIRIYKRCHEKMNVSLAEIQDAFSEFMEKVLNGKYKLRLIGLEPITFGTEIQRSIQLSYKRKQK